jgi:hypothetical protein
MFNGTKSKYKYEKINIYIFYTLDIFLLFESTPIFICKLEGLL